MKHFNIGLGGSPAVFSHAIKVPKSLILYASSSFMWFLCSEAQGWEISEF